MRARILLAFERAESTTNSSERDAWLTFVVAGAGPTGVELAGALAEIARHTLKQNFRHIAPASARVLLIESGPEVLPAFSAPSSKSARRQLERLGVTVLTSNAVTFVNENGLKIGEENIAARTVLWAAGVAASPLGAMLGAPIDRAGRVGVTADLSIPDHPEVFVVGISPGWCSPLAWCRVLLQRPSRWASTRPAVYARNLKALPARRSVIDVSDFWRRSVAGPPWWKQVPYDSPGCSLVGSGCSRTSTF